LGTKHRELQSGDIRTRVEQNRAQTPDDLETLTSPSLRKTNLARRPEGIFVAPFEQGEIRPDLFRAACKFGLEGMVAKRDRPYRAGQSTNWLSRGARTRFR
jgi:bifunctional non-homologous end joining protein LigD